MREKSLLWGSPVFSKVDLEPVYSLELDGLPSLASQLEQWAGEVKLSRLEKGWAGL